MDLINEAVYEERVKAWFSPSVVAAQGKSVQPAAGSTTSSSNSDAGKIVETSSVHYEGDYKQSHGNATLGDVAVTATRLKKKEDNITLSKGDVIGLVGLLTNFSEMGLHTWANKTTSTELEVGLESGSQVFNRAGHGLALLSVFNDVHDYRNGEISKNRLTFHLAGTGATEWVGAAFGTGPGITVFLGAYMLEKEYDLARWEQSQLSTGAVNFQNALNRGWVPGR